MRLDKFLWFARLAKTRPLAQALAEGGHLRIDGRPMGESGRPVTERLSALYDALTRAG